MHAGEGPCLATFFVTKYWQFLLLRVLTGISVGGTLPLVYSLVGDLFNAHQRATVAAGIQIATGIGLAAGQAIAGFVGEISKPPLPRLPSRKVASDFITHRLSHGISFSPVQEIYGCRSSKYTNSFCWQIKLRCCTTDEGLILRCPWSPSGLILSDLAPALKSTQLCNLLH